LTKKKIRSRWRESLGKTEGNTSERNLLAEVTQIVTTVAQLNQPVQNTVVRPRTKRNKLYTGEQLIEENRRRREEIERQEKERAEAKKKEKEEKKKEREKEREAQREAKLLRRQQQEEKQKNIQKERETAKLLKQCRVCTTKWRQGKNWWLCEKCQEYRLCPHHTKDNTIVAAHKGVCF
jgi:rubrerythrin